MSSASDTGVPFRAGHVAGIPVRNIWLLMLYASELYRSLHEKSIAVEENPDDIPDLVAEVLAREVERRLSRNLTYAYQRRNDVLSRVRGRIDLAKTERHRLLERGLVACRFDELTADTPRNRFVRAALERMARVARGREVRHRSRSLAAGLRAKGVVGESPGRWTVDVKAVGRHGSADRQMLAAARLAFELALPMEVTGARHLFSPGRDVQWLRRLYERGVGGFYDVVLTGSGWHVERGKWLAWPTAAKTPGIDAILPRMQTDIVLVKPAEGRRVVIDTKFNAIISKGWHREGLRSSHLYQIYAYLRSQEGEEDPLAERASGLLLHPSTGETVNEAVTIQGHEIRFATVDLAASAKEIRAQLLNVVGVSL